MRIQHVFISVLLVAGVACSRNNVKINGIVEGGEGSHITFERLDVNRTTAIDTVKIKQGGVFSFVTKPEEPELYILKNEQGGILNLLLSPGDRVSVKTTSESFGIKYTVDGSAESENIRLLVEHLNKTRAELDSLLNLAESIKDPENPEMDIIRTAYAQSIIRQKRYTISYLVQNMTSLSSVYALYQKFDDENPVLGNETDLQYFIVVADSLETVHPNSSLTKSLRADIETKQVLYRESLHLDSLLNMAGDELGLLDLTIPDRDGNDIILSSLKGKVILVVFWASGNEASIQSLLQLQSTYGRYGDDGFEIYAISLDNNKIQWMNALDFNEFSWINVSELSYPDSRATVLYNVTGLPSTFLINREGDIVAKNLYGKTLETWLDNLL